MTQPRIRPCRRDELPAVLEFWRRHAARPSPTDDIASLEALHTRDPDALLVAEDGGALVGTVIAGWDGWRAGIYRIVADTTRRRRGLGTALVRAAVASLEARGARRINALVDADDPQAMAFWRSLTPDGFIHDTGETRFVRTSAHTPSGAAGC